MARRTSRATSPRATTHVPLRRERIVQAAIDIADRDGLDALSMRRLGQQLGVDPMSLYNHIRDKDDLLDAMVDGVVAGIEPAPPGADWKQTFRLTVLSARASVLRHPWTPRVIEARPDPGPATMRYLDSVLGILRAGGFSVDLAHHALHAMGSRILGFSQDLFDDSSAERPDPAAAAALARQLADAYPYAAELAAAVSHEGGLGGCDDDVEFAFALDLILDGLDRLRSAA